MFVYGGVVRELSEDVLEEWVDYLVALNTPIAAGTEIDLYHFCYLMGEPRQELQRTQTLRVLMAPPFLLESLVRIRRSLRMSTTCRAP
jgi:hypothetical protein